MHVSEGARRKKIVGVLDEFFNICHWIYCIFVEHHSHTLYQAQTHDLVDIVSQLQGFQQQNAYNSYHIIQVLVETSLSVQTLALEIQIDKLLHVFCTL